VLACEAFGATEEQATYAVGSDGLRPNCHHIDADMLDEDPGLSITVWARRLSRYGSAFQGRVWK
jgi:hypothetical protein